MGMSPSTQANLFLFPTKFQLLSERQITLIIGSAQIGEQPAALANHLKQTTATGLIVLVCAQMLGQLQDTAGQDGHLDFGGASIGLMTVVIRNDFILGFFCKRHDVCFPFFRF